MSCPRCDEDKHEEFITEICGVLSVGVLQFDAGRVLRELDPIAFNCSMSEYEDYDSLCEECRGEFDD